LDGLTGNIKWKFSTGESFYTSPAVSAEGTVYVSGASNKLYAVDGRTGGKKWEFSMGTAQASAPTIGADGTVYVTQNGTLYAVQGDRGLARSAWPKFQGNAQNTGHALPLRSVPALRVPYNQTLDELTTLCQTNTVVGLDSTPRTLSYGLVSACSWNRPLESLLGHRLSRRGLAPM
jgi:hypothetical protein